jgi:hypothetical protein
MDCYEDLEEGTMKPYGNTGEDLKVKLIERRKWQFGITVLHAAHYDIETLTRVKLSIVYELDDGSRIDEVSGRLFHKVLNDLG